VAELRRADLAEDPLEQFRRWFEEARPVVRLPEAMAVATAAPDGGPSVRMLLLKAADERGFVFFTGYVSRKGAELDANPRAALLFYWDPLGRQVRVEGTVQRVPAAESDEYFATRPQGSRLGAAASRQSAVLASRAELERAVGKLAAAADESVRRPSTWGGYRLAPETYEFWQHRDDRLHLENASGACALATTRAKPSVSRRARALSHWPPRCLALADIRGVFFDGVTSFCLPRRAMTTPARNLGLVRRVVVGEG
jgi:pyridoxamine 5'-phosphate oxidase